MTQRFVIAWDTGAMAAAYVAAESSPSLVLVIR